MAILHGKPRSSLLAVLAVTAALAGGCGAMEKTGMSGKKAAAELGGMHEVPPVSTQASGSSSIAVASDRSVSGTVTVSGMTPTAAHIHHGAAGANGPVIIPLEKTSDKAFRVPSGTRLTDDQYAAYKGGNLYVNVHSAAHPGGEVRVQMTPQ